MRQVLPIGAPLGDCLARGKWSGRGPLEGIYWEELWVPAHSFETCGPSKEICSWRAWAVAQRRRPPPVRFTRRFRPPWPDVSTGLKYVGSAPWRLFTPPVCAARWPMHRIPTLAATCATIPAKSSRRNAAGWTWTLWQTTAGTSHNAKRCDPSLTALSTALPLRGTWRFPPSDLAELVICNLFRAQGDRCDGKAFSLLPYLDRRWISE